MNRTTISTVAQMEKPVIPRSVHVSPCKSCCFDQPFTLAYTSSSELRMRCTPNQRPTSHLTISPATSVSQGTKQTRPVLLHHWRHPSYILVTPHLQRLKGNCCCRVIPDYTASSITTTSPLIVTPRLHHSIYLMHGASVKTRMSALQVRPPQLAFSHLPLPRPRRVLLGCSF